MEVLEREEIENGIMHLSSQNVSPVIVAPILDAISRMENEEMKFRLYERCLCAVEENNRIDMETRKKTMDLISKKMDSEIDAKRATNKLFSNPYFLIFMYLSPWIAGIITSKMFDNTLYGTFITILMYLAVFALHPSNYKNNVIIQAWNAFKNR